MATGYQYRGRIFALAPLEHARELFPTASFPVSLEISTRALRCVNDSIPFVTNRGWASEDRDPIAWSIGHQDVVQLTCSPREDARIPEGQARVRVTRSDGQSLASGFRGFRLDGVVGPRLSVAPREDAGAPETPPPPPPETTPDAGEPVTSSSELEPTTTP